MMTQNNNIADVMWNTIRSSLSSPELKRYFDFDTVDSSLEAFKDPLRRYVSRHADNPSFPYAARLIREVRFLRRGVTPPEVAADIDALAEILRADLPPQVLSIAYVCAEKFQWRFATSCPFVELSEVLIDLNSRLNLQDIAEAPEEIFESVISEPIIDALDQSRSTRAWK